MLFTQARNASAISVYENAFFAPSDDAWDDLSEDVRSELFGPESRNELKVVLQYQIIEGEYLTRDLTAISP